MSQTQVDGFLARARRQARWTEVVPVAREIALLFAVLAASAWIAWPRALPAVIVVGAVAVVTGAWCVARARRFDVVRLDASLQLRGWLASYVESQNADPSMRAWLADRLAPQIPSLPASDLARRLRGIRRRPQRLVTIVLLILFLLRLVWLPQLPTGVLPLGSGRAPELNASGSAAASDGDRELGERSQPSRSDGDSSAGQVDPSVAEQPSETTPDASVGGSADAPPPPSPRSPLPLPLPSRDAFLPAAMVEPTGRGPASDVPPPSAANAPARQDPPPVANTTAASGERPPRDYRRAREQAMRSRHLEERERAGVAAWFDALLERDR
ncbi:MAG: hypothetical protein AB7I19_06480 [Planctomycetota bacterium]